MEAADIVRDDEDRVVDHGRSKAMPAGTAMGLRERKKLETFRALQCAARRLVGERGLDNVSIDEIVDAANLSKRTFFNYFDSKEAAVVDAEPGMPERLAASLAARSATETPLQAYARRPSPSSSRRRRSCRRCPGSSLPTRRWPRVRSTRSPSSRR